MSLKNIKIPSPKELLAIVPDQETALCIRLKEVLNLMRQEALSGETSIWIDRKNSKIDDKIEKILEEKGYYVDTYNTRHCNQMCIQWGKKYESPIC